MSGMKVGNLSGTLHREVAISCVVGFGLRVPDDASSWFFIEPHYMHGLYTDAPTYIPIRFGWEIAL